MPDGLPRWAFLGACGWALALSRLHALEPALECGDALMPTDAH